MSKTSCYDWCKKYFENEDLIKALLFQFGDAGMAVDELPFVFWAVIHDHYFKGGYFPRGNTAEVVRKLLRSI